MKRLMTIALMSIIGCTMTPTPQPQTAPPIQTETAPATLPPPRPAYQNYWRR